MGSEMCIRDSTKINVWRQQNAEPQRYITTKAKAGFFGIGGKAARTYENPEWSSWNKNLNDVVTTKTAEIQAIAQENTQLGYQ